MKWQNCTYVILEEVTIFRQIISMTNDNAVIRIKNRSYDEGMDDHENTDDSMDGSWIILTQWQSDHCQTNNIKMNAG